MSEEDILEEAMRITSSDRNKDYGDPRDNLQQTADLWQAYLHRKSNCPLDARDVANMMILLKISRDSYCRKRDNVVDIAGWARLADLVANNKPANTEGESHE